MYIECRGTCSHHRHSSGAAPPSACVSQAEHSGDVCHPSTLSRMSCLCLPTPTSSHLPLWDRGAARHQLCHALCADRAAMLHHGSQIWKGSLALCASHQFLRAVVVATEMWLPEQRCAPEPQWQWEGLQFTPKAVPFSCSRAGEAGGAV